MDRRPTSAWTIPQVRWGAHATLGGLAAFTAALRLQAALPALAAQEDLVLSMFFTVPCLLGTLGAVRALLHAPQSDRSRTALMKGIIQGGAALFVAGTLAHFLWGAPGVRDAAFLASTVARHGGGCLLVSALAYWVQECVWRF